MGVRLDPYSKLRNNGSCAHVSQPLGETCNLITTPLEEHTQYVTAIP